MSTKSYIFAGIMSAIIGNAYATGENTVTSKSYVDAQDALKQDLIDAEMMTLEFFKGSVSLPTLVSYDTTDDLTGTKYAIVGNVPNHLAALEANNKNSLGLPTLDLVLAKDAERQYLIPESGKYRRNSDGGVNSIDNSGINSDNWLSDNIKGVGLVTKTTTDGEVGERKIFEATDVANYHAQALTQFEKDVQDISIPTVGAMMTAISSGVSAGLPTGTAGNVVTYDANGDIGGSVATANSPTYTNGTLTNGTDIATIAAVETKQNKMTCAGWPDSVPVADRTDANCWLWNKD